MSDKKLTSVSALDTEFSFESYGVRVSVHTSGRGLREDAEETVRKALLDRIRMVETTEAEHVFDISSDDDGKLVLYRDEEKITHDFSRPRFFKFFDSILRLTIAEYAVDKVFIHAGVVGWKGRAIVIPANSFQGKTTLVSELVRQGAEYYSDEYAVLDEMGLVHSFPRDLSVRYVENGEVLEKSVSVQDLGGKAGSLPIPVGMLVLTEFDKDAVWEPDRLTVGQGIMEVIPHTIPRHFKTQSSLKVLNTALSDAIILKSQRGEAADFAVKLLYFFDNFSNLAKIT